MRPISFSRRSRKRRNCKKGAASSDELHIKYKKLHSTRVEKAYKRAYKIVSMTRPRKQAAVHSSFTHLLASRRTQRNHRCTNGVRHTIDLEKYVKLVDSIP